MSDSCYTGIQQQQKDVPHKEDTMKAPLVAFLLSISSHIIHTMVMLEQYVQESYSQEMNSQQVSVQILKTVILKEVKVLECFCGGEENSGGNPGC